jgi:hypothetical protein
MDNVDHFKNLAQELCDITKTLADLQVEIDDITHKEINLAVDAFQAAFDAYHDLCAKTPDIESLIKKLHIINGEPVAGFAGISKKK